MTISTKSLAGICAQSELLGSVDVRRQQFALNDKYSHSSGQSLTKPHRNNTKVTLYKIRY